MSGELSQSSRSRFEFFGGLILIWVGLLFSYRAVWGYPLLDYDDPAYLTGNPLARQSLFSIRFWQELLGSSTVNLWHPLTVLSHQLGLRITSDWGWHHLANLLAHGGVATLWAFVVRALSGKSLVAVLSAMVFAWHPVTVESVAWLSGRKDVLCAMFLSGMMLSHLQWVRGEQRGLYMLTLLLGMGAMLSKPVAFSAPLILLAFDLGPLKRPWDRGRLLTEKWPWLIPSVATVLLTLLFQGQGGQAMSDPRNLLEKVAGALWAVEQAAQAMIWPTHLHLGYRDPSQLNLGRLLLVGLVGLALLVGAVVMRKKHPLILFGAILILLTLGPTLGLIRAGNHLAADRYCYLPMLGASLMVAEVLRRFSKGGVVIVATLLVPLLWLQSAQTKHWESLEALFTHALAIDPANTVGHVQLAQIEENRGNREAAVEHLRQALQTQPGHVGASILLANIAYSEERWMEAKDLYLQATRLRGSDPALFRQIAECFERLGDSHQALLYRERERALRERLR